MIIDTGENVTIISSYFAYKLGEKLFWTPLCVILQTVPGDKINVKGKFYLNIVFGDVIYGHVARVYVADISDPFILELDFMRENNFK